MTRARGNGFRPLLAACLTVLAALVMNVGSASAAACPGSPDPCPWTGTPEIFGDVADGSLRLAQDIAFDAPNGIVWIVDGDRNQLKRYSAATGAFLSAVGTEGSGPGQFDFPQGIAVDGAGAVYVADTGNNRVQKLSPAGAHMLTIGDGSQGPGNNQLIQPLDVAADSTGDIYVADSGNRRVQRFSSAGAFEATIGGPGDGDGQFGTLGPGSLAIDASNALYVTDPFFTNERIHKFVGGTYVGQTGSPGHLPGQFQGLGKIAVLGSTLYAMDFNRLQKMDTTFGGGATEVADGEFSGLVGVAAGTGALFTVERSTNGGGGTDRALRFNPTTEAIDFEFATDAPGQLLRPGGLAVDTAGNVYVADTSKNRIVKFEADGDFAWAVGAPATTFNFPISVATDGTHLWVSDSGNGRIRKLLASDGSFVEDIAPVEWDANEFPTQVALHGSDLYVADPGMEVVWKVSGGAATVFHGEEGTRGSGADELDGPRGVAVQGTSLWVADTDNNRLKKLALADGAVQATVGSFGSGNGQFDGPNGLAATSDYVYVADTGNSRVQRLDSDGAFQDKWGDLGRTLGEMRFPAGVVARDGGASDDVHVLDSFNDRVQLFDVGAPTIPPAATPVVTMDAPPAATTETMPHFEGTASAAHPDDSAIVEVKIHEGNSVAGLVKRTLEVDRTGTDWSTGSPTNAWAGESSLPDGVYTAQAIQNNPSAPTPDGKSLARTFEVDTTPPEVNLSTPVDNSTTTSKRPAISGTAGVKGGLSHDTELTFELRQHLSNGTNPHVNQGPIVNGFWNVDIDSSPFNTTIPTDLGAGTYHLRAYQADEAGNQAVQGPQTSRLFTVVVPDTTDPDLDIDTVGNFADGKNWVNASSNPPTFKGKAGNAAGDSTTIDVFLDLFAGGQWNAVGNRQVTRSGNTWSGKWGTQTLGDGRYRVRAEQKDGAGNEKKVSTEFTIDTKKPTLAVAYPVDKQHFPQGSHMILLGSGSTGGGERSVRAEIYYDVPGKGWESRSNPAGVRFENGGWAFDLGELGAGHWFAWVFLKDAAGNEEKAGVQWYIDPNSYPDITIRRPKPDERFHQGDAVASDFECSDPDDGDTITECTAPSLIDTSTVGEHKFEVKAKDGHGATRTQWNRYWVDPPRADKGIRVQGVEFMQAVQTAGVETPQAATVRPDGFGFDVQSAPYNGIRAVKGKAALARVYVAAPDRDVSVFLYGYHGKTLLGPLRPTMPWDSAIIDKSERGLREKQRSAVGGYAFLIPNDWTKKELDLVAFAIPTTTASPEVCRDCSAANGFLLRDIAMTKSRGFKIGMVVFPDTNGAMPKSIEGHLQRANDILPIPDGSIKFDAEYRATLSMPSMTKDSGEKMLDALDEWDQKEGDNNNDAGMIMGVAPKWTDAGIQTDGPMFTPTECGGFIIKSCTYHRPVAMTVADARPLTGTTHEIGHALGRPHASGNCGGRQGGSFESWPPDHRGHLQGVAMDRTSLVTGTYRLLDGLQPADDAVVAYDLMTYCNASSIGNGDPRNWISPKAWNSVLDRMSSNLNARPFEAAAPGEAQARGAQSTPALAVSGYVDADGNTVVTSVRRGAQGNGPADSPYRVIARNASGAPIANVPLAVQIPNDTDGAVVMFSGTVPATGAESLVIAEGSKILATVTRSPNAPKVKVVSPKKNQNVSGRDVTVAWTATDPDGGTLEASIEYSADDGRNWRTISVGEIDGKVSLPSTLMTTAKRARVRVTVNDGWNETAALSEVFSSEGAPPSVRIVSPAPKTRQGNDATLQLIAQGTDERRKDLRPGSFRWYDGKRLIARGASALVAGLAPGTRTLRVEATDSRGRKGSDKVKVRLRAMAPRLFGMKVPKKIGSKARRLKLKAASTIPGKLKIGRKKFNVGLKPKRLAVPVKPGGKPLRLTLVLSAHGKKSKTFLTVKR
ncbi:MAG TPA: Ig-like domain-containing protein [Thermoleophilaceae bacterium]|nr:Ig-like domain-containing protein [Thermoleophilaceae bacterium]